MYLFITFFFITKLYLFVGYQYFDYADGISKLFGSGPKIILFWACV